MMLTIGFLSTLLGFLFFLVAAFMILVVLIQKPKGGGLSGAFGGGGSGGAGADPQAMFGAKVGDVLTYITVGCFLAFILLAISLVYLGQASVTPDYDAAPQTTGAAAPDTPETPESPATPESPERPAGPETSPDVPPAE